MFQKTGKERVEVVYGATSLRPSGNPSAARLGTRAVAD